ncbi:hypothetical protein DJ568_05320 [Mucilaginibacter hurinus]|uniref:Uncharacterized protein n=2 Tax=Mucilaginibacter hurinus TaxID=2201324 RepID=A0A367GTM4_9SPHI|nr:hypothetical protein DJ568_05320 [Mucilaginibacter hurinus]
MLKINLKTTRLAYFLTLIHIVTRGMLYSVPLLNINLNGHLQYLLLFLAEFSYLGVLVYLILVLRHFGYKWLPLPLILLLITEMVSFATATFFRPDNKDTAVLYSGTLAGLSVFFLAAEVWLSIATYHVRNNHVLRSFRLFAFTLLSAHIAKTLLTVYFAFLLVTKDQDYLNYVNLLYLVPPLTVFFIIQRVSIALGESKVSG